MSNNEQTQRRTALVTGASYGIGAAIAEVLARDGYDVAVNELNPEALVNTLSKIKAHGARALAVPLDVRSQPSIEACMQHVLANFGKLDLLVNNAGVLLRKPALDITREEWQNVIDINLTGTFFMSQQMGRHLIATKRKGSIISISSTHAIVGVAAVSAYGISKAGISQMTRMLAIEWASHGIRVNAIAPGTTETPSRKASFGNDPVRRQHLMERIPFKRFCTEVDVAGMASYLASPAADYVTGQTLLVDGGLTAY
ncbi:MAG: SDR family oxidoreductase [Betaproteobacteria bacterium]|nr:SDR family oxidoreductase [Betaproteobacteria bacterium]